MTNVLVLNYDYTPLNLTSTRRGFILIDKGKAEIIKSDDNPINTGYATYVRPLIIRLLSYIKILIGRTQRLIEAEYIHETIYECIYCGSSKTLTLDHVLPKSRGGRNEWYKFSNFLF